jgi:hypothetical protein
MRRRTVRENPSCCRECGKYFGKNSKNPLENPAWIWYYSRKRKREMTG